MQDDIELKYGEMLKNEIKMVKENLEKEMNRKLEYATKLLEEKYNQMIKKEKQRKSKLTHLGGRLGR